MAAPLLDHHPHSYYGDILRVAWKIMSDLASTLKNLILPVDPIVATKMPSTQPRRAACTHLTMSRVYGPHKCTHCNRPSRLGWVYSCTQDDRGHASEAEEGLITLTGNLTIDHQMKPGDRNYDNMFDPHVVKLSSWMEEAILEGHYTLEQVTVLRAQRQKVKNCIAAAGNDSVQGRKVKLSQLNPVQTTHVTSSLNQPSLSVDEQPAGSTLNERQSFLKDSNSSNSTQLQKLIPDCSYKTCQICRPVSRDRAWGCFDHIFQAIVRPSSLAFRDVNRPISNATLVRGLGLRVPKPRSEMFGFDPGDSVANGDSHNEITSLENYLTEADSSREYILKKKGLQQAGPFGFRARARRSMRSILISPRPNSTHSRDSKDLKSSGPEKTIRDNALVTFVEDLSCDQRNSSECDLGSCATRRSWRRKNGMAVRTNSKSAFKDQKKENGDDLHVPNGVAVTEEAVDLGTADIIMQV